MFESISHFVLGVVAIAILHIALTYGLSYKTNDNQKIRFLNMGYQTNHDLWNHQKEGRFQEKNDPEQARQANSFAFALLMPEKEYRKMIDLNSEGLLVQTKNIAEYFGVSLAAAAQRGRELNILT